LCYRQITRVNKQLPNKLFRHIRTMGTYIYVLWSLRPAFRFSPTLVWSPLRPSECFCSSLTVETALINSLWNRSIDPQVLDDGRQVRISRRRGIWRIFFQTHTCVQYPTYHRVLLYSIYAEIRLITRYNRFLDFFQTSTVAAATAVFVVSKSETEGEGNLLDGIILLYENAATSLDDGCTV